MSNTARVGRNNLWWVASIASTAFIGNMANADESRGLQLEEVIVTAQKRSESLQDAPMSLSAIGAEQLELEGISSMLDIQAKVPGLQINPSPTNNSTLSFFIRGVGQADSQITLDSPVAIYLDGVYLARNVGLSLDIADLERIEVLRGPQGALYGKNATGGAVTLATRRPNTQELELKQKFVVGVRERSSTTTVNLPVSDTVALKFAYLLRQVDGFMKNPTGRGDYGDKDIQGGRIDVRWNVNEAFTIDYGYDASNTDYYNATYQPILRGSGGGTTGNLIVDGANQSIEDNQGYQSKRRKSMASAAPLEESQSDSTGHTLVLSYIQDASEFKYIFGLRTLYGKSYVDLGGGDDNYRLDSNAYTAPDGEEFPLVYFVIDQEQSSHEVQYTGAFLEDRLGATVGGYYMTETATDDAAPEFHVFNGRVGALGTPLDGSMLASYDNRMATIENDGWAVYAQLSYTPAILDEKLKLTVGARHSEDTREAYVKKATRAVSYQTLLPGAPGITLSSSGFEATGRKTFTDDSFEWIVHYSVSDDINVYAKYSEAYRSGGFNTRDADEDGSNNEFGVGFVDGFEPEKVNAYEIGVKSELFDRRLRLNADVFMSSYVDMQTSFFSGESIGATKAINAGKASMDGFELDATWLIAKPLLFNFGYAYLDASIDEVINPATGEDQTKQYTFLSAPTHSYNTSLDWTILDSATGRLYLYVSHNYMAERAGSQRNVPPPKDWRYPAYKLWNARLGMADIKVGRDGNVTVAAWAKNVLDEEYPVSVVAAYPHSDRAVIWGEPRSYGVDVIYQF